MSKQENSRQKRTSLLGVIICGFECTAHGSETQEKYNSTNSLKGTDYIKIIIKKVAILELFK